MESPILAWRRWPDFELPQGAFPLLGEAVESSYASSPRHDWGATPSAFSPAESPALRPGVPIVAAAMAAERGDRGDRGGAGGERGSVSPLQPPFQPAVIPM